MYQLIVCVAVAWGGCVEQPPVYYPSQAFCLRAAQKLPKDKVQTMYCRKSQ